MCVSIYVNIPRVETLAILIFLTHAIPHHILQHNTQHQFTPHITTTQHQFTPHNTTLRNTTSHHNTTPHPHITSSIPSSHPPSRQHITTHHTPHDTTTPHHNTTPHPNTAPHPPITPHIASFFEKRNVHTAIGLASGNPSSWSATQAINPTQPVTYSGLIMRKSTQELGYIWLEL